MSSPLPARPMPDDTMLAALAAIRAEQIELRALLERVLAACERGRGPRDAADADLLRAIAEVFGDRTFTSADVLALAAAHEALTAALLAADVVEKRDLGTVFRTLHGVQISGLRLDKVDDCRDGAVWQVRVCESESRTVARL